MPYQPTGPSLRHALQRRSADPFDQAALLRLFQNHPEVLAPAVRTDLERAVNLDSQPHNPTHKEA